MLGQWILHALLITQVFLPLVVGDTIEPMPPVAVTEGEPFNLTCIVAYSSEVEGIRLDKELPGSQEKNIYKLLPPDYEDDPDLDTTKYSVIRIGKSSFTITVKAAVFDDAGTYVCRLMGDRSVRQTTIAVVVRKPKIQIKKILHPGEVIPVTCDVEYDVPNDLSEEEKADRVPKLRAQIGDAEQTGTISTAFKRVIMTWNMTVSANHDGKKLICRAYTPVPDFQVDTAEVLNVKSMVSTIEPMPPVAVAEGEPFNLTCIVTYSSQMEGIRLDKELPGGQEKNIYKLLPPDYEDDPDLDTTKYSVTRIGKSSFTITVKAANFDDAGTYVCRLVGDLSVRQITIAVVVRKPKIQIKKILHPGEVTPVTCDVEYDIPNDLSEEEKAERVPKLSAQIGDAEQTGTISTAFKRVIMTWNMTVSANHDGKKLICRAYTPVPDFQVDTAEVLNVKSMVSTIEPMPPVAVAEGEPFNLSCIVTYSSQMEGIRLDKLLPGCQEKNIYKLLPPDYNDDPNLDSTRYSVTRIGHSSFTITVKAASFRDEGTYMCVLLVDRSVRQTTVAVVVTAG